MTSSELESNRVAATSPKSRSRHALFACLVVTPMVGASVVAQPAGPASALALAREAQSASAARNWAEAARLWAKVVELNPVQPGWWYALGSARCRAKDYAEAIPALERAATLGAPLMGAYYSIYEIARCQALAGNSTLAIAALERAFDLGYPDFHLAQRDSALASIRQDPRVIDLLGLKDVSRMSRDEGWRYDLSILAREVRRKGFNIHLSVQRPTTLQAFDAKVKELDAAIPRLGDGAIVLSMMKLMVSLQDGHSAIWDVGEHPLFRAALPLRFFWFEEGLFVTAVDPKYRDLLGAEVLRVDGRPAKTVLEALDPFENRDRGNPQVAKTRAPYVLRKVALLHAAGLAERPDRATFTVRDRSGATREVTVDSDSREPEIWNTLPAPKSWITYASTLSPVPLYLRHMDQAQWFEYLPDQKAVYFQFNGVRNDPGESLSAFTQRLIAFIDGNAVDRLIIDMRWNNGGNTGLGHPLLLAIIGNQKVNRPGKLFVILGRRTYSAAQNMSTYFERYTNATFVGEPTGSSPNFVGEEVALTLPYSKVMGNVSHLFWQSSWPQDQRIWLAPQIYVPPTAADFLAGRDAALAAIWALQEP